MGLLLAILVIILVIKKGEAFHLKMSIHAIDSHLHVWGNGKEPFPYVKGPPPDELVAVGSTEALLEQMDKTGVRGALIVQPINYLFDHSYVLKAINDHPDKFKGMCLLDPSCGDDYLTSLKNDGFCSVRFNPYLPEWNGLQMSGEAGTKLFAQCGELGLPVGFMCFQGFKNHAEEIKALLESSPTTTVVLDHWGFFVQDGHIDEESWRQVIELAQYSQVHVKISAPFRNVVNKEEKNYPELAERLRSLLTAYGPSRLMWGTDFPFVSLEDPEAYSQSLVSLASWGVSKEEMHWIISGTAEKVFGKW